MFPLCALVFATPLAEAPAPAPTRIGFDEALDAAARHPELRAARARFATREAEDTSIAGIATDPLLQVQPGYRFGPDGINDGFDGSVGLMQTFNLGGWGQARRVAASAERAALATDVDAQLRAFRRRAARAWLEAWTLEREQRVRTEMLEAAEGIRAQVERRYELGVGRELERAQVQAFVAAARLDLLDAEGRRFDAALRLAEACGLAHSPLSTRGPPPGGVRVPDEPLPLADDADVRAVRAASVAADERATEAAAQSSWRLLTGVSVAREPPGDVIPSATLGVTLPVSGRNQRSASTRAAERDAARERLDATEQAILRQRVGARHEYEHAAEVLALYDEELVPARRREVEVLARQLELGNVAIRHVLDARLRLLEAQVGAVRAHGQFHGAAYDLQLLSSPSEDSETRS